ncbi:MAG: hypothetical protein GF311_23745 [Candidatus Lokiarchaeota archaeon]|nr:hypothetical protein [Candidatus Lokiarchaeota archaeon]
MNSINDLDLLKFFKNNIDKAKFFSRKKYKHDVVEILKEIIILTQKAEDFREKRKKFNPIPQEIKKRLQKIQILWHNLLREAIYSLRDEDDSDTQDFKEDFGMVEIINYFNSFTEFEEILYGSDRYYRDHSLHVIRVFLLGYYLLIKHEKFNSLSDKQISFDNIRVANWNESSDLYLSIKERQAIWVIISLTHDLGYPIEKMDRINQKIKEIMTYYGASNKLDINYQIPIQNLNLNNFLLNFISSKLIKKEENYFTVIQNKYYIKNSNAFENYKHGIMSSLLLLRFLTYFKESDYSNTFLDQLSIRDAKQFLIRRIILRSIASHDNDDIYYIFPNDFSFLLVLCDDLQEWNRPSKSSIHQFNRKIYIKNFGQKRIEFQINIEHSDGANFEDLIINLARKIKHYIMIFRSAPDSDKRDFAFIFSISFNSESFNILNFEYLPNNEPRITFPLISEKKDFFNFFKVFIENNYSINRDFHKLIERLKEEYQKI